MPYKPSVNSTGVALITIISFLVIAFSHFGKMKGVGSEHCNLSLAKETERT
jgi:hypothetical protein